MTTLTLAVLTVVAVASALLSSITGVAGGIVLLSALLILAEPRLVVPVHGATQLVANITRLVAFWRHIHWPLVWRFTAATLPGSLVGASLVSVLPARALQIGIAVTILVTLIPRKKSASSEPAFRLNWYLPLGFGCGLLGMVVGSTGPLLSQALLHSGVVKEQHIATKSACQAIANAIKLVLYGVALSFSFGDNALLIALLSAASVVGTLIGKRVLGRISERTFELATRVLLGAIAVSSLIGF